jgi:hypothetical protein
MLRVETVLDRRGMEVMRLGDFVSSSSVGAVTSIQVTPCPSPGGSF